MGQFTVKYSLGTGLLLKGDLSAQRRLGWVTGLGRGDSGVQTTLSFPITRDSLREALQNCSALRVQCAWKDVAKLP